jgi:DnaK suppressor protein
METQTLNHFKTLFTSIINQAAMDEDSWTEPLENQNGGDVVDLATGDREQQLALKLKGRQSFFLKKVELALDRINRGSFGICEECEGEIGEGRLLARPTATQCITCKEEQEKGEKHIPYQKRSHTHGLGFSEKSSNVIQLKLNDDGDGRKRENNFKIN